MPDPFWYLATPYTNYPLGRHLAHVHACQQAALLIDAGISVYSPIAHSDPIAVYGHLDPKDHDLWLTLDEPMMAAAHGLIVCMLDGWDTSRGVVREIHAFREAGKPTILMTPGTVPIDEIRSLTP